MGWNKTQPNQTYTNVINVFVETQSSLYSQQIINKIHQFEKDLTSVEHQQDNSIYGKI